MTLTVAKRPCGSCPYRQDVPSGVWAQDEYDKLPSYDGEFVDQAFAGATGVFMCHQRDGCLCAGWLACHGPGNLLALPIQEELGSEKLDPAVWTYETDVPVWASGREAREHGMREYEEPGVAARRLQEGLLKKGGVRYNEE